MQYAPTWVHEKTGGFWIQTIVEEHFGAYAFAPYTGTCKICPILGLNHRRGTFRGVCNTPLHGYVHNLASFRRKPLARDISGRMQYAPTRVRAKFGGFWA